MFIIFTRELLLTWILTVKSLIKSSKSDKTWQHQYNSYLAPKLTENYKRKIYFQTWEFNWVCYLRITWYIYETLHIFYPNAWNVTNHHKVCQTNVFNKSTFDTLPPNKEELTLLQSCLLCLKSATYSVEKVVTLYSASNHY